MPDKEADLHTTAERYGRKLLLQWQAAAAQPDADALCHGTLIPACLWS